MVEDAMLEIAMVNIGVEVANVEASAHKTAGTKRCHGNDGDASRQSSRKGVMTRLAQSRPLKM
jgi:hypothetical protein